MNTTSRKALHLMRMKPARTAVQIINKPIITLAITIMVLLSPIMIFVNPLSVFAAAPASYEKMKHDRIDASSSNSNNNNHAGPSSSPVTTTTTTTTSSSPDLSQSTSLSPSMTTGTPTIQGPLTSPSTKQTNNIVNTQSEFAVTFKTSTTGVIKKILVTFPAGTNLGSVNLLITREGIGPGVAEKTSSTTITYTVTSAVSVPANTLIKLEFGTIVNSPNPGNQFVTVSTRDAANAIIDGPTAIGYSLKQIGTGDIADNAVTTSKVAPLAVTSDKIATGAITSTKPSESFMKRITLLDGPTGNALGWDPNGIATSFTITQSLASLDQSMVVGSVWSLIGGPPLPCFINSGTGDTFVVSCQVAPPSGAELHYLITVLPGHFNVN